MVVPGPPPTLPDFRVGGPETLFGVVDLHQRADGTMAASMPVPEWALGGGAYGEAAVLGVLVDNVLGYVVNEVSRTWSVSTELSVDLCAPLRAGQGAVVTCTGRAVHVDLVGAVVEGEVRDRDGALVARCVLRGRFTDRRPQDRDAESPPVSTSVPADLAAALRPEVELGATPMTVAVSSRFTNPTGSLHGGMAFCLVEAAAATSERGLGRTAAVRLQLVRGTPLGGLLTLHTRSAHTGRSLAVVEVEARDDRDRAVLLATVTREACQGGEETSAGA